MASTEYLPEYLQRMIKDELFVPEEAGQYSGKDLFADPTDDPNYDEEAALRMDIMDAMSNPKYVDSTTLMLESVDPIEGRLGADMVDLDRIIIPDPLINLTMRSHVLPAAIQYEGFEYARSAGLSTSADSQDAGGGLWYLKEREQRASERLIFVIHINPLLAGVCLGLASWERAVNEVNPGSNPEAGEAFHMIAFKGTRNVEMGLEDPVKRSLGSMYGLVPNRKEDILFEGRLIPSKIPGHAEFIADPLHIPQGIEDVAGFARTQRENAARYLLSPTPETPSLLTRMLHPRCSKLVIS